MIAEYEEEICRSREENERQRQLLDALLKHQDEKHRAESPYIKEEEHEHSIGQEEEQFRELEDGDVTKQPFNCVIVKSEDDDGDGDHCGGSQADNFLTPLSNSDNTSPSPDTDDDEHCKGDATSHSDCKEAKECNDTASPGEVVIYSTQTTASCLPEVNPKQS
ncbi:uncharacterized protein LOC109525793 isoform X4 [Hippocampus comes]|uniref:uncharacterized protein LOC109525792 isoform X4 n=1 Tax=Hippocampus comes TaxID=109280 RepID=UPI00094E1AF6|nr:PREDICTED: uncharacterized protein LOC109525792 isoform X4 [Hippocampus comes]XP_019742128.1 PREDICTED: uncharacterized protein LOC109525793 isoform X4 [Hippocampus comes]